MSWQSVRPLPLVARTKQWIRVSKTTGSQLVLYSTATAALKNPNASRHHRDWPNLEEICRTGRVPRRFNFARDVFDRHVFDRPDSTAFWVDDGKRDRKWTFSHFHDESVRAALVLRKLLYFNKGRSNLAKLSLSAGEKQPFMFTLLPRVPEWWFLYMGSIRNGTIFSPGTVQLTPKDIQYRLEASNAQLIVTDEANVWKVEEALTQVQKAGMRKPIIKMVVGKSANSRISLPGWLSYYELIGNVCDKEVLAFQDADTKSDDFAQVFFTSGTTGMPKMLAHNHTSYGIGHFTTAKLFGLQESDVNWTIADPGWALSSYGGFFSPWIAGCTVYVHQMERVETRSVLETLVKKPITSFICAPTTFRSMVQEKDLDLMKFKNLRWCLGAGEAVNPEVARVWKQKTGLELHQLYGQTETTGMGGHFPPKEGSFGKLDPNISYDLQVIDDEGNPCPPSTEGNLALKVNPTRPVGLFAGYLKMSKYSKLEIDTEKMKSCHIGDYYLTGDRGYVEPDGYFYYVSRADDVIISAGYRIGPIEVESALQEHPAVLESAVVPSPDSLRGAVVKAFIVLTNDFRNVDKENLQKEIQEHAKKLTAPYKYPRKIEFVDSLPKTISGKILRRELKRMEYDNDNTAKHK